MNVKMALFDAFGTLIKIQNGTHPYRRILRAGIEQGRRPKPKDAEILLSLPLDLQEAADFFGIAVPPPRMAEIQAALDFELEAMEPHSDGLEAVRMLQNSGIPVGICSNLAKPYAGAIERLYPSVRLKAYSFEAGVIKPAPEMYKHARKVMNAGSVQDITMIGDSCSCDREGPRKFGMNGYWLRRDGFGDYASLIEFAEDILRSPSQN